MVFSSEVFDAQVFDVTKPKVTAFELQNRNVKFTFQRRMVNQTLSKRNIELRLTRP